MQYLRQVANPMQETKIHDLPDDADYAASIQQGPASLMRSDSSIKRSTSSEPEGAEVVYKKDNVTIHHTQFASERISGRFKFGGASTEKVVEEKFEKLKKALERDGYKVIADFLLARYNPPWTLPAFRTNEVFIPVE